MNTIPYTGPSLNLGDLDLSDEDYLVVLFHHRKGRNDRMESCIRMMNASAHELRMRQFCRHTETPEGQRNDIWVTTFLIEKGFLENDIHLVY